MVDIRSRLAVALCTVLSIPAIAFAQHLQPLPGAASRTTAPSNKMTIEIWSDVVCPFCYIGKREFESALARFPHKDEVVVEWKSFELDPSAPKRSEHDMYGMLVAKYGGTRDEAKARVQGVVQRAKTVGLDYQMDKAVIGNSFDAHRVIQLAKTMGKGAEAEERLFKAYFMEGAHLADHSTLVRLATEIGLEAKEVEVVLASTRFTDEVRADEAEAQQIGVRGVPFFAIDQKYGISGAQASDHFLSALEQAWKERSAVKP